MAKNFGALPGGMAGMVKSMQTAMKQAEAAEAQLAEEKIEGAAGGGVVKVVVTGKGEFVGITISPEVVDPNDVRMLEDLVSMAIKEALEKATTLRNERLQKVIPGGGLGIPGLF